MTCAIKISPVQVSTTDTRTEKQSIFCQVPIASAIVRASMELIAIPHSITSKSICLSYGLIGVGYKDKTSLSIAEIAKKILRDFEKEVNKAFITAIETGHTEILEALFSRNLGLPSTFKKEILFKAIHHGFTEVVRLLLLDNLKISDKDLGLAVDKAVLRKNIEIVRLLLGDKATISDENRSRAIFTATTLEELEIVRLLLPEETGFSESCYFDSLSWAIRQNFTEIARLLISKGIKGSDDEQQEFIETAIIHEYTEIVDLLFSSGVKIAEDKQEEMLFSALRDRNPKLVSLLLKNYGPISTDSIKASLLFAAEEGCLEIAITALLHNRPFYSESEIIKLRAYLQMVFKYPNEQIKDQLLKNFSSKFIPDLDLFLDILNQISRIEKWTSVQKEKLLLPLVMLMSAGIEEKEEIVASLKKHYKCFKDYRNLQSLLQFQNSLEECELIQEVKSTIYHSLLRIEDHRELIICMSLVSIILSLHPWKLIGIDQDGFFRENLVRLVVEDFIKDGYFNSDCFEFFLNSRNPQALFKYCGMHKSTRIKALICFFTRIVVDGKFQGIRNLQNSHAKFLSFDQIRAWETALLPRLVHESDEGETFDVKKFLQDKLVIDHHAEGLIHEGLLTEDFSSTRSAIAYELSDLELAVVDLWRASEDTILEKLYRLKGLLREIDCEFKNDVNAAILMLEGDKSKGKKFEIIDSDDPIDLFLCGTEVLGSCQRVDGDPHLNQCLMGYVLDGKSRLLAIKDPETNRIVARAMIKILVDSRDRPQLFFERVYGNAKFGKELLAFAKQKAENLGVALFKYSAAGETLYSRGNFVNIEYEDGGVGITNGIFELKAELIEG
jgi:ankyrin repeat protein